MQMYGLTEEAVRLRPSDLPQGFCGHNKHPCSKTVELHGKQNSFLLYRGVVEFAMAPRTAQGTGYTQQEVIVWVITHTVVVL